MQIERQGRRERRVARELEEQQIALAEAQLLIDRSEIGHMLSPRLVTLRRAFKVWSAMWQERHEISILLVRHWRARAHRTLHAAFSAWWETVTSLKSFTSAQLAAKGDSLKLHGNGPALARWFYFRCDSVTKRIGSELTQLVADSQLYQQQIDIVRTCSPPHTDRLD